MFFIMNELIPLIFTITAWLYKNILKFLTTFKISMHSLLRKQEQDNILWCKNELESFVQKLA